MTELRASMMSPKSHDCFHNALSCLGNLLLDRKLADKHDVEELGCLILVLADYARLMENSLNG
ncbi:MAG: hypothetical protein Q4B82_08400 [Alysiella sp.]|uniref:hypothetical protein n=1 Tax=Alysiella sp. TaxID=1872483 RepID=UPI0026DBD67C|nr:hypothetical protein [Alysiella sp.]MDO4434582.1 hypothetical protein [Alysiella sp.]